MYVKIKFTDLLFKYMIVSQVSIFHFLSSIL